MTNPLLQAWTTPFGLPPFDQIKPEHFVPAFEIACEQRKQELAAIALNPQPANFENTVQALDASGRLFYQVKLCFENLTSSDSPPELQAAERELAPKLAAHEASIYLDQALFTRLDGLYEQRHGLGLSAVQLRLLERLHLDFVLAGAKLKGSARERFAQLVQELASSTTQFAQNVLADEAEYALELHSEQDLEGLPSWLRASAQSAAQDRKSSAPYAITLSMGVVNAFLTFSARRELRERLYQAWANRGNVSTQRNNAQVIQRIMQLRHEQAQLMGYANYSQFALADTMAGQPQRVHELLDKVWEPAKRRAQAEEQELQALAQRDGLSLQPWDWRYYAEQLRVAKYAVEDAQVKPYFSLKRMTKAMFDCANKLFGIEFHERTGMVMYHPDVTCYEVTGRDGQHIGLFLADNYARPNKAGGAWMNLYRQQSMIGGGPVAPIVGNNNNFAKPPTGQECLLSFDEVRTLFHEFGHGLHGLLSKVPYERLSGTNVLQDFVELPSQLFEHWALEPQVLKAHALHVQTGEPISDELIGKLRAAKAVNQGYETVQFCASALLDMKLHQTSEFAQLDVLAFEAQALQELRCPALIPPRHRLPHFRHLFSGSYYASKYYVYLWAEVLDADAFDAFLETNNIFDPATAKKLYDHIYSTGNTVAPELTYQNFRGKAANVEHMLRKKGLLVA